MCSFRKGNIWIGLALAAIFFGLLYLIFGQNRSSLDRRYSKKKVDDMLEVMHDRLSESEVVELNGLIAKGVNMLPSYDREELLKLQEKFVYGSYKTLSEEEVTRMKHLNYKGIGYLTQAEKDRFKYLMHKGGVR